MKKMTLKNKTRYKIWKHMKNKLNKKIEKLSYSATYLDKLRYKVFKYLSKKLSKKNLIQDVSVDLRRFKEYITQRLPKNKTAILYSEMMELKKYIQKVNNDLSLLNRNVETANKKADLHEEIAELSKSLGTVKNEINCLKRSSIKQFPQNKENELFLFCAGTGSSGNTATMDFYRNYDDVSFCEPEFDLFRYCNYHLKNFHSIFTLYQKVKTFEPIDDDLIKLSCYWRVLYWHAYHKQMDKVFLEYLDSYVEKVSSVSKIYLSSLKFADNEGAEKIKFFYRKEFINITLEFMENILSLLTPDKSIKLFRHGIINGLPLDEQVQFFNPKKWRLVRTIRDPRDIWVDFQKHPDFWWAPKSVEDYIKVMPQTWAYLAYDAPNIMAVHFEDLCLNYEDTSKKLLDFVGLDKNSKLSDKVYFDPNISKKNVGMWKAYENQDEIRKIEKELPEYLWQGWKD